NHRLRQRRVHHPVRPEALLQAGGGAEYAAVDPDVLAQHHDAVVVLHLPGQRHGHGLDERDARHQWWPPELTKRRAVSRCSAMASGSSANIESNMASTGCTGVSRYAATAAST